MEAAVSFCSLGALQNVVKPAEATSAHVAFHETDDAPTFEVSDGGRGFDPEAMRPGSGLANLADHLDPLDGTLQVTSVPGRAATIRGEVFCRAMETVP